jgi:hypothetical protein
MLDDDEELLQFERDGHNRRQHDDEGALLLAGDELCEDGLDDLSVKCGQVAYVTSSDQFPSKVGL